MRGKPKPFYPGVVQHIYQRAIDKGVIFYTIEDRIVYYTLAAVNSRKMGVKVLAFSIMFTHTHQSAIARRLEHLRAYLHDVDTSFSRSYNFRYSRHGRLFEKPPGRSQKRSSKDIRSNLAYVFNNHVEKGLCRYAVDERWSFLAYATSSHPYSKEIDLKTASKDLLKAINLVSRRVRKNKPLEYGDLDRILPKLNDEEVEQFIDFVISRYELIDFNLTTSHYEDVRTMILAIDSTTGGEYEIREDCTKEKDTGYLALTEYFESYYSIKDIFKLPDYEKMDFFISTRRAIQASDDQIRKFIHFDVLKYLNIRQSK